MKSRPFFLCIFLCIFLCFPTSALIPASNITTPDKMALPPSSVVFMYHAKPEIYDTYGTTHLAWGPAPTPKLLSETQSVEYYGSIGMVTEFSRFYERFPERWEQSLCIDLDGNPIKIPWLLDHQHKGVPFWKCCTLQPAFRDYLRLRVIETLEGGAQGIHIDDHMGNAAFTSFGACFCERCKSGFRDYLKTLPTDTLKGLGITELDTFDFRTELLEWRERSGENSRIQEHPLWQQWEVFHCYQTRLLMQGLKSLARKHQGRYVPFGANAGLLWNNHLTDYESLDLISAETEHQANLRKPSDLPLLAYRLAEAVERPYAATASGADWAFVKAHDLSGLVRYWIAYAYASGQLFMAPNLQWCHTDFLGTHWYQGPKKVYSPLYRFIRTHQDLFDSYQNHPQFALILPYRNYVQNQSMWFDLTKEIASSNFTFEILLSGDDIVPHPLELEKINRHPNILCPTTELMTVADQKTIQHIRSSTSIIKEFSKLKTVIEPLVLTNSGTDVRFFPREGKDSIVIHILNNNYSPSEDAFKVIKNLKVSLKVEELGIQPNARCQVFSPDHKTLECEMVDGTIEIPELKLWSILKISKFARSTVIK